MEQKEKLLKRLPQNLHWVVKDFEAESDLIDDCKYMLYFNENVKMFGERIYSYPVKSIKEAIDVITNDVYFDDGWDRWECEPSHDPWDYEYGQ